MIIELVGVGPHNKGAEMMMSSILQNLKTNKDTYVVYQPRKNDWSDFFSFYGVKQKSSFLIRGHDILYPIENLRDNLGWKNHLVDVILDSSGFAYSDQWGEKPLRNGILRHKRYKNALKILMPQALGPFKETKELANEFFTTFDLIFARDKVSYENLKEIKNINLQNIHISDDFTCLLQGADLNHKKAKQENRVLIIPNARMLDKNEDTKNYISYMQRLARYLRSENFILDFMAFGGDEDLNLVDLIDPQLHAEAQIINSLNHLIQNIGIYSFAVSSRYHGVMACLDHCVPCYAIGWSHKYSELLRDAGLEHFDLTQSLRDNAPVDFNRVFNADSVDEANETLRLYRSEKINRTQKMFTEVRNMINNYRIIN